MKVVFLFPGQGNEQYEETFNCFKNCSCFLNFLREVSLSTGIDIIKAISNHDKNYNNLLTVTISLGIAHFLKNIGIHPDYILGHSLGEYTGLAFSNAVSEKKILNIVMERENILKNYNIGRMYALRINNNDFFKDISNIDDCYVSLYNSDSQVVVSCSNNSCHNLENYLEKKSIHYKKLPILNPFHSPLMENINQEFKMKYLSNLVISKPKYDLIFTTNPTLITKNIIEIERKLFNQLTEPVFFSKAIDEIMQVEDEDIIFIEIGNGQTLTNLCKSKIKNDKLYATNNMENLMNINQLIKK